MKKSFFKYITSGTLKLYYLLIAVAGFSMLVMCTSQDSTLKFGLKLYVSTTGNDSWSGKLSEPDQDKTDGPFATIEGARDAIRLLKEAEKLPKGNVISRNICVGGNWDKPSGFWNVSIEDKARPYLTMEDNVVAPDSGVEDSLSTSFVIADPLFVNQENPEQGKFQLDADSPALKRGFKQIPFDKIGLYQSDDRASWPVSKK